MIHPEFGYALTIGRPGIYLAFAGGVRFRAVLEEQPLSNWNALGEVMNLYTPVLNITVGFAI